MQVMCGLIQAVRENELRCLKRLMVGDTGKYLDKSISEKKRNA